MFITAPNLNFSGTIYPQGSTIAVEPDAQLGKPGKGSGGRHRRNEQTTIKSLRHFFRGPLNAVRISQREVGDCYFLAGADAVLQSRDAELLLSSIHVESYDDLLTGKSKIAVCYITGKGADFDPDELGKKKNGLWPVSAPFGMRIFELSYLKAIRDKRNAELENPYPNAGEGHTALLAHGGQGNEALKDIFGGIEIDINGSWLDPKEYRFSDTLSHYKGSLDLLRRTLSQYSQDNDNIRVLTAYTPDKKPHALNKITLPSKRGQRRVFWRAHEYAVHSFSVAKDQITVSDPADSKHHIYTLTLEEFCHVFAGIAGIEMNRQQFRMKVEHQQQRFYAMA